MKKGFTLIELLAVIVILAIVAIIAIPVITNVIDKAKVGAAKSSVLGYIDALEKNYVIATTNGTLKDWPEQDADGCYIVEDIKEFVKVKGSYPSDDTKVCLDSKHNVSTIEGKIDGYEFTYDDKKVTIGDKTEEVVLAENAIGTKTKNLLDNNTNYGNYTYMEGTYLKGVQDSNYVSYNGFLWRIMGKNSDGTIKLITEENIAEISWGVSGSGDWNASGYLKDWLNNYFYSNLDSSKTSIIKQDSKWCINMTTNNGSARTDCTGGSLVESKVGLISIDEYNLSGASQTNNTYGLINGRYYWTLTPYSVANTWHVYNDGGTNGRDVACTSGARPVINVSSSATITSGNGTLGSPYIVS